MSCVCLRLFEDLVTLPRRLSQALDYRNGRCGQSSGRGAQARALPIPAPPPLFFPLRPLQLLELLSVLSSSGTEERISPTGLAAVGSVPFFPVVR